MMRKFVCVIVVLQVTSVAGDVDVKWMNDTLANYFSQPRHHVTGHDYKVRAMTFILDQFKAAGLETYMHNFTTENENVAGVNVIGVLKGRFFNTSDDRVAGIAAHYDTMRNTPGVDDNGAAVVTMLEAARAVSRQPHRNYTVIFIAFDFEESEPASNPGAACSDLCGSNSLVAQWMPSFFAKSVGWRGIFVMDTIMNFDSQEETQSLPPGVNMLFPEQTASVVSDGKRGDFLMVAGRQNTDQPLLDAFSTAWNQQGQPKFEIEAFPIPLLLQSQGDFVRSDHAPFWEAGYNALFLSDTANFRGYMKACYHNECDTLQHVTVSKLNFIAKTCKTLIAMVDLYSPVIDSSSAAGQNGPDQGAFFFFVASFLICTVGLIGTS